MISNSVEESIVAVSLQYPDFGARRLVPVLKEEEIVLSASKIYTILKRNGLNTRVKRLAKLEEQHALEKSPPQDHDLPSLTEEIAPTAEASGLIAASPGVAPGPKRHRKRAGRAPWFLTFFNLMLLAIFILLGIHTLRKAGSIGFAPITAAAVETAPQSPSKKKITSLQSLGSYRIIWLRDLFKTVGHKQSENEISVDELAPAAKNLGLKLMGTVVADNPEMSRAVIDNRITRQQEIYREGDRAGEVLVTKILRNKVVITTNKGNELLTIDFEESPKGPQSLASRMYNSKGSSSPLKKSRSQSRRAEFKAIQLERKEVEASLSDLDQLLQEVNILPFKQGGRSVGFRLTNITPGSILAKMGLRNGVAVTGVNGEEVTSPDQAAEFFQQLKKGGDITIQTSTGRRVRRRPRSIHLKIE